MYRALQLGALLIMYLDYSFDKVVYSNAVVKMLQFTCSSWHEVLTSCALITNTVYELISTTA